MKVCHFIASRGLGRGEFYVDLVNELSAHCEVSLLVPEGARYLGRVSSAVSVVTYKRGNSRRNPFLLWELARKIQRIAPDVVHTHFGKATEMFVSINRLLRLPHVATKHNPRKGKVFNRLPNVIAVSNKVRESIKGDDVTVINTGIRPVEIGSRQGHCDRFRMVAVGRLDPIKGFDLLIEELAALEFDFHLKIIGSGPEQEHLSSLVDGLGLKENIELAGYREDIPRQLREADLVLISSHSEGCPVVAIETLFYGNLLLSTPVGNIPEILPSELLVEHGGFAARVTDVFRNYSRYRELFERQQAKLQSRFLLSSIAEQHLNLYQRLIGEHE